MKINNKYIAIALGLSISFGACETEEDLIAERKRNNEPTSSSIGSADFSNYVSIGNSLTAGFADGALYPSGQSNSYASLLAQQIQLAGGGEFIYPDIASGNGFGGVDSEGNAVGKRFIDIATALAALAGDPNASIGDAIQTTSGSFLTKSSNTGSDLNNFGVPGARLIDVVAPGYGAANPYYGSFQSSAASSILGDAVSANASMFTMWLGSNDVLGYAIAGGVNDTFNPLDPSTITDAATFGAALSGTLDALSAGGADGIVLNIPPVTLTPFFQTVTNLSGGVNLIPLTEQGLVDQLNGAFNVPFPSPIPGVDPGYNSLLDYAVSVGQLTTEEAAWRKISWELGANPPMITDESLTALDLSAFIMAPAGTLVIPQYRQAKVDPTTGATDLFPLTALSVIGELADPMNPNSVYGVGVAVPDASTLTLDEQGNVVTAYATFNAIIAGQAAARPNIHLLDVGPLFADIFGLSYAQAAGLALSTTAQEAADGELGIIVDGINYVPLSLSQEQLLYSIWSTDGIHPNPKGAGIVANEIIKLINTKYNASIKEVDITALQGINAPL